MAKRVLAKTEIGVAPYSDGSGYAYTVCFTTEADSLETEISIESSSTIYLTAVEWEAVRNAIDGSLARHTATVNDLVVMP